MRYRIGQATIADVATRAGVSTATVSRVVNGTSKVSPETLKRVEAAVEALGFVPQPAARMLAGGRTMTLGLLVPEISGEFFLPMLRGIERAAGDAGYELLIQTTAYMPLGARRRILGDHNTDGLLLFADSVDDEAIRTFESAGLPAVLLYRDPPRGSRYPAVTVENEQGAFLATSHLIRAHGRRRVLFVAGPAGNHDGTARGCGYRAALADCGIAFDPDLVVHGGFSTELAFEATRDALKRGVRFDAVFAADDGSAFGAMSALGAAGIDVPEDVAVVGFDDVSAAARSTPSLSTVRAPTELVGDTSVRLVLECIRRRDDPEGDDAETRTASVVLPTEFIARSSCGCMVKG